MDLRKLKAIICSNICLYIFIHIHIYCFLPTVHFLLLVIAHQFFFGDTPLPPLVLNSCGLICDSPPMSGHRNRHYESEA